MTEKQQRVCGNHLCKTSNTPLWRKGWTDDKGSAVMLCNACGLHYKKKHFCLYCNQIYREADAETTTNPWISCDRCSRWTHAVEEKSHGFDIMKLKNQYLCPECREELSLSTAEEVDNAADLDVIKKRRRKPSAINAKSGKANVESKKRSRSTSSDNVGQTEDDAASAQPPAKKRKTSEKSNVFNFESFCANFERSSSSASNKVVKSPRKETPKVSKPIVVASAPSPQAEFGECCPEQNDSNFSFVSASSSSSSSSGSQSSPSSAGPVEQNFACPYEISVEGTAENDLPRQMRNSFIDSHFLVPPSALERPQPTNYSLILQKMMKVKTIKYPSSQNIGWSFKHMTKRYFGDETPIVNYTLLKFIPFGGNFQITKPYSHKHIQQMLFGADCTFRNGK